MARIGRVQRGRVVGLGALVAVIVGSTAVTAAPAAAKTVISIKSSSRSHDFTQPVTISGRVASHRSGVRLKLYASEFPFTSAVVAGEKSTKQGGRYRFRVKAELATRYVVARSSDPTVQSKSLTVYTFVHITKVKCNLCKNPEELKPGSHTLNLSYRSRYPARVYALESIQPHFFYYGQRNGSTRSPRRLDLIRTLVPSPVGTNTIRVSASHQIQVPSGGWRLRAYICYRSSTAVNGFGSPEVNNCGDQTITRPR